MRGRSEACLSLLPTFVLCNPGDLNYLDDSLTNLTEFEGVVPWMYLDTKGLVTVGVGQMLPDAASAQSLAFTDPSGQPATQDAIQSDYDRVSALAPGKCPGFYHTSTSLVLPDPAIDMLLMKRVTDFDDQLRERFQAYASFPDPAKLGLLDMIYNLGRDGLFQHFPHFMAAVDKQDWLAAAANCHRVGPSQARNDWTRQQFLAAVAGSTPADSDPAPAASTGGS